MDEEVKTPNVKVETVSEQTDLSLLGLIYEADFFVQIIMLLLLLSSIWCWTIIINKSRLFRREKKISKLFQEYYDSNEVDDDTLLDFYNNNSQNQKNAQVNVFIKAMLEFNKIHTTSSHSVGKNHLSELVERVQLTLQIIVNREIEKLEQGISFLASIGSVAPFIGLLGTVWGIVNAFQSIAITNNTSLAVVAPGIAEALFATALGLLAAIPAVAAYNKYSNDLEKISNNLEYFIFEFTSKKTIELERKFNV
jgi:biopolymer transport protein TolQ